MLRPPFVAIFREVFYEAYITKASQQYIDVKYYVLNKYVAAADTTASSYFYRAITQIVQGYSIAHINLAQII
jgi:hypothetical protein